MMNSAAAGSARHDAAVAIRNGIRLAASLIATWTVAIVLRLQLPRHLGPELFGQFNFCDALMASVFSFLSFGAGTYIMKEVAIRPQHASDFFGGLLLVRAVLSLVAVTGTVLFVIALGRPAELVPVLLMFGLVWLMTTVNNSLGNVLQASTQVRSLATVNVVAKFVWGAGLILAIWFDAPLYAFALPNLIAELLKLPVLLGAAREAVGLTLRVDLRATRAMIVASLPFFTHSITVDLGMRIDVTMLEMLQPGAEVGWYSAANSFAGLALLLAPAVSWVIMPLLARAHERSLDEFFAILNVSSRALLIVAAPAVLLLADGAEFWVRIAFGDAFVPAARAVRVLAPMFLATYIAMLFSVSLVILKRNWTLNLVSFLSLLLEVGLIIGAFLVFRGGAPGSVAMAAGLGLMLSELLTAAMLGAAIGRRVIERTLVITILKQTVLVAAVLALGAYLGPYGPVRLAIEGLCYLAGMLVLKVVTLDEVRSLVQLMRERRAS